MLEIALLGQFEVRLGGQRIDLDSRIHQKLLAYLAVRAFQTVHPRANNQPLHAMPFFGHQGEQAQLSHSLADPDVRFITISGLGSVGKTHLAYSAAERQLQRRSGPTTENDRPDAPGRDIDRRLFVVDATGRALACGLAGRAPLARKLQNREIAQGFVLSPQFGGG